MRRASAEPGRRRSESHERTHQDLRCRLAAYNAGYLHGVWIDATLDLEDIQAQVDIMLAASLVEGAEEYAIHNFEGFDGYDLGEYEGLEKAHETACFIEEYPEFGGALLAHVNEIDEARKAAEEDYCGCYTSLADYVQDLRPAPADFASIRVHGLKHTCGRRLWAARVTEEDRKALLGNKNGSITSH